MALTPKQRQFLRGLAHSMEPVVRVGKGGVSESVVAEARRTMAAHELIKVRIEADGDARRVLAEELAAAVGAEIAGLIGKMAIFYRPFDDEPDIKLPR